MSSPFPSFSDPAFTFITGFTNGLSESEVKAESLLFLITFTDNTPLSPDFLIKRRQRH